MNPSERLPIPQISGIRVGTIRLNLSTSKYMILGCSEDLTIRAFQAVSGMIEG